MGRLMPPWSDRFVPPSNLLIALSNLLVPLSVLVVPLSLLLVPLSVLLVAAIPAEVSASPPDSPTVLSSALWSGPNGIRVMGGTAYVAYATGLAVLDVSDPATPRLLGRTWCTGWNGGVSLSWPVALLGSEEGIRTFDVQDPSLPREIGVYHPSAPMNDFVLAKNLAYLACLSGSAGLEIVDFSDPANPVRLGSCATYASLSVELAGRYALLPGYHDGVAVVDISQPDQPRLVGNWNTGAIVKIRVDGDRAYCMWVSGEKDRSNGGDRSNDGSRDESGVIVYGIADPLHPTWLGEYRQEEEWARDIFFEGGLAYLASGSGTATILDFSDPANPVVVGRLVTGGSSADFDFENGIAYVADGSNGIVTAAVGDPSAPAILGRWWEGDRPVDIAVDDRAAYVADTGFGLHVLDIRDPLRPEVISRLPMRLGPEKIVVSGEFAYLGDRDRGFDVVDLTALEDPAAVAHLDLPVSGIAVAGERAYVVKDDRFTTVDITDPPHPAVLGSCTIPLWAREVCVHGDFAYVGDTSRGLLVVDVSDPAHPFPRGSVDTFDWMYNVVTDGSIVYANLGYNRLGVYDVTDPDAPRSVRELQLPGTGALNGLHLAGNRLFAAAPPGIRVYDVSTPDDPIDVGTADVQGSSIDIRDPFLYLIGGGSLLVLGPSAARIEPPTSIEKGLQILAADPLRGGGEIRVQLDRPGPLRVAVYDVAGRRVATLHEGAVAATEITLRWTPGAVTAGVYFVRAESQGRSTAREVRFVR